MANNKEHKANYTLKTVTGKVGNMGFKQTSGDTNTLASRGAKLICLPEPKGWRGWNNAVNLAIETNDSEGIDSLEKTYKDCILKGL